ncbi:MAG: polymerase sigma factor RpoE [Phycisphaerales bacterium]|nr:polymerase sigma factor RpoE [Phycisphaerales bacterium]
MPPRASNPKSAVNGQVSGAGPSAEAIANAAREADLFRMAREGDRGAFGQLAIRTQDRLYTAIVRLVGEREEARELTQEAFVKALAAMDGFRGESGWYTWIFRIGVNLALTHLRKVQRRRTFSLDTPRPGSGDQANGLADRLASPDSTPDQIAQRRETRQQVIKCLGELDSEQRALLVLRDVEGMDYQQMADVLEVPLGTLKSKLFRARLALREKLLVAIKK